MIVSLGKFIISRHRGHGSLIFSCTVTYKQLLQSWHANSKNMTQTWHDSAASVWVSISGTELLLGGTTQIQSKQRSTNESVDNVYTQCLAEIEIICAIKACGLLPQVSSAALQGEAFVSWTELPSAACLARSTQCNPAHQACQQRIRLRSLRPGTRLLFLYISMES